MPRSSSTTPEAHAARAEQPGILLDSESPYGSRRGVVEYDGATTAAYLHDADAIVIAVTELC